MLVEDLFGREARKGVEKAPSLASPSSGDTSPVNVIAAS